MARNAPCRIDWEFWRSMPEVKAWQAVALTLGIDPDQMNQCRDYWRQRPEDADIPSVRIREEFDQRLKLLVVARANSAELTAGMSSTDTPANHRVRLEEVVRWVRKLGRTPLVDGLAAHPATAADQPPLVLVVPAQSATPAQKVLSWQEDQLRRTTRALGYDPLALPADDPRTHVGVKSLIRTRCRENHPIKMRATLFNKAWDRLLATPGGLKYAD